MATDAAISEPGTDGAPFTDRGWRAAFAGRTGIVDDVNGSSFNLTLPAEGATAELGSSTQPSRLVVDGYGLEVAQGATQSLTIPASSGGGTNGRTDLIVARLNLSVFTTAPGPVRLHRIAGTEGSTSRPAATYDQDGIRDLPLYAVRRIQGQSLNQAIVTDLRPRLGHNYDVPLDAPLPTNAPLASRCSRGGVVWRRDTVDSTVDWVAEWRERAVLTGTAVASDGDDYDVRPASRLTRKGPESTERWMNLVVGLAGDPVNPNPEVDGERRVGRLAADDRPFASVSLAGVAVNTAGVARAAAGRVDPDGWVVWVWASTGGRFPTGSTITLSGPWEVPA
jgi:hypothetical protein